eukprot:scaffold1389_cov122-Cylindrotheca_fusiformis.AAC.12
MGTRGTKKGETEPAVENGFGQFFKQIGESSYFQRIFIYDVFPVLTFSWRSRSSRLFLSFEVVDTTILPKGTLRMTEAVPQGE